MRLFPTLGVLSWVCVLGLSLAVTTSPAASLEIARAAGQPDQVGIYNGGQWILDVTGDGLFDPTSDLAFFLGFPGAEIVVGDWDGDGRESAGVFAGGFWYLDYNGDGYWDGGVVDKMYPFGWQGTSPVVGDWNGDGATDVGVYNNGSWFLDFNGNRLWDGAPTDRAFSFGWPGAEPHVGDWNGDGASEVGFFAGGTWFLDYDGNQVWDGGATDRAINLGWAGATMLVGDWDGDGRDQVGVFSGGFWFLDYDGNGLWDGGVVDQQYPFGWAGVTPVTGDWNGDGKVQVGVFHQGNWFLDQNGNALWDGAPGDKIIGFGAAGNIPVPGRWGYAPGTTAQVDPPNGQIGAPTNRRVIVTLPGSVDPGTVSNSTVTLKRGAVLVAVQLVVSPDGRFLSIRPTSALTPSSDYTLTINGLKDLGGADLMPPFSSTFRTGAGPDNTSVTASAGTLYVVPRNASLFVEISPKVDPADFDPAAWYVQEEFSGTKMPLDCSLAADWSSVACTLTQPLWAGATHEVYGSELASLTGRPRYGSGGPYTSFVAGFTDDHTAPQLVATAPPNGSTDFPLASNIRLLFSERVNLIGPGTKIALERNGVEVPVQIQQAPEDQGPQIILDPASDLLPGTSYKIVLENLRDMAGLSLAGPVVSNFTTSGVSSTFPSASFFPDGSAPIPLNPSFRVTFTRDIIAASVNPSTLRVLGPNGAVPATFIFSKSNEVTLKPSVNLLPYSSYRLVVGPGLFDVDGWNHRREQSYVTGGSVDVVAPSVLSVSPPNGATGVPPNAMVSVILSEAIDPGSVTSQSARLLGSNKALQLFGNNELRLPSGTSTSGTGIELKGLRDLAGNVMPNFTSSFQASSGVIDNTGPTLLSTTPARGATGVPLGQKITLTFNEGIAPGSLTPAKLQLLVYRDGVYSLAPSTMTAVGNNVEITPVPQLLPNAAYKVDVVRGQVLSTPTDYVGNQMTVFEPLLFTAGSGAMDTTPPQLISSDPADGSTKIFNLSQNLSVEMTFSEAIDPSTLNANNLFFLNNGRQGSASFVETFNANKSVRFRVGITGGFSEGSATVIVAKAVRDVAGNELSADQAVQFTLQDIGGTDNSQFAVKDMRPKNGSDGAPADAPISLLLTRAFDPATLNQALYVTVNGDLISGSLQSLAENRIVKFTPDQPFPGGATVQVIPRPEFISADGTRSILNALTPYWFSIAPDPAVEGPVVVGVSPNVATNAGGNTTNSRILARLSQQLDPASVTGSSVYLTNIWPNNGAVVQAVSGVTPEGDMVEVTPTQPLTKDWTYALVVTTAVRNTQGQHLQQGVTYQFDVIGDPDLNSPAISAVSPPNGFPSAPVNTVARVRFSEAINPLTIRDSTFRLLRNGQPVPAAEWIVSTRADVATLKPLEYLAPDTTYTVEVQGVQDASGNPVANKSWTFHTGAVVDTERPEATSYLPQGSEAGVNSKLILRFNEAIDQTGVQPGFFRDDLGQPVTGSLAFSPDGKTLVFSPDQPLLPNSDYDSNFDLNDLTDQCCTSSNYGFTTGGGVDLQPPSVVSIDPASGATNVSPLAPLSVEMSEFLDPLTVNSQNVRILDAGTPVPILSQLADNLRTIQIFPVAGLPIGRTLTVEIAGVSDTSGNAISTPYTSSFSTKAELDFVGPYYFTNANGPTDMPRDVSFTIVSTETLDPASVTAATVYFASSADGTPYASQPTLDPTGRFIRLSPVGLLPASTSFLIKIDGVTDTNGNLAQRGSNGPEGFTTGTALTDGGPPTIARFQPLDGAVGVPLNVIVNVDPSEDLDPFSYTGDLFEVRDSNDALVAVRTPLQYQPPLKANETYTIHTKAAADFAGNALPAQTATFTTSNVEDNTRPTIVSQVPVSESSGVPVNVTIVVDFDEPVVASNIVLRFTNPFRDIPTSWSLSSNFQQLTIQPLEVLAPNSYHSVYMTIFDSAGNGLKNFQGYHAFGFTTGAAAPLTQEGGDLPRVLRINPPAGAAGVSQGAVTLTLSSPLDPSAVGEVFLTAGGAAIESAGPALTADGRTLEIPLSTASPSGAFGVRMSPKARDVAGLVFEPFESGFELGTSAAHVVSILPPPGAFDVLPTAAIRVRFSEALDPTSVPSSLEVLADEEFVTGELDLSDGGRVLVFVPDLPLRGGAEVLVRVRQSMLRSAAGASLAEWPYETVFRVAAAGDAAPSAASSPAMLTTVASATPVDGAQGVSTEAAITVRFDGLVGPSSLQRLRLVSSDSGEAVPTRVSWKIQEASTEAILTPHQPLEPGAAYEVRIVGAGEDHRVVARFTVRAAALAGLDE
ncbi:MAG: hypothetical protein GC160_04990 [Acidobacteria bacterium]|nr:hypothetical protein [Acidobacteriota bacterium]